VGDVAAKENIEKIPLLFPPIFTGATFRIGAKARSDVGKAISS